jgi:hypothetical protein
MKNPLKDCGCSQYFCNHSRYLTSGLLAFLAGYMIHFLHNVEVVRLVSCIWLVGLYLVLAITCHSSDS